MMGFKKMWKDLDCNMVNQGKKLVITITGDEEKIANLEKKLNAMRELGCCHGEEDCC